MRRKIIPYQPYLKELARKLRNNSTLGEILLWNELKNKQFYNYDFHRQKPLLNYITDFYCYELALIIEIDGQYHNNEAQFSLDVIREEDLKKYDLSILRFSEHEVKKDIVNVLRTIEAFVLDFEEKKGF